ncbi:hypothetical protein CKO28_17515 [Rhodovibrio sodomensis]|uniref:Uncharacterized protein n=1 Tax=Rhodovibrio sodomensis TaxID=1088 RepID=A0ABS1DH82_9PROT|nr:hypothetical protein [Rhodovibrio sodomensis]MBK1669837.1 hypothetical protein [Rhodovibrio sodomensis]
MAISDTTTDASSSTEAKVEEAISIVWTYDEANAEDSARDAVRGLVEGGLSPWDAAKEVVSEEAFRDMKDDELAVRSTNIPAGKIDGVYVRHNVGSDLFESVGVASELPVELEDGSEHFVTMQFRQQFRHLQDGDFEQGAVAAKVIGGDGHSLPSARKAAIEQYLSPQGVSENLGRQMLAMAGRHAEKHGREVTGQAAAFEHSPQQPHRSIDTICDDNGRPWGVVTTGPGFVAGKMLEGANPGSGRDDDVRSPGDLLPHMLAAGEKFQEPAVLESYARRNGNEVDSDNLAFVFTEPWAVGPDWDGMEWVSREYGSVADFNLAKEGHAPNRSHLENLMERAHDQAMHMELGKGADYDFDNTVFAPHTPKHRPTDSPRNIGDHAANTGMDVFGQATAAVLKGHDPLGGKPTPTQSAAYEINEALTIGNVGDLDPKKIEQVGMAAWQSTGDPAFKAMAQPHFEDARAGDRTDDPMRNVFAGGVARLEGVAKAAVDRLQADVDAAESNQEAATLGWRQAQIDQMKHMLSDPGQPLGASFSGKFAIPFEDALDIAAKGRDTIPEIEHKAASRTLGDLKVGPRREPEPSDWDMEDKEPITPRRLGMDI